jgi:Zn-dependent M28 family amino/carboxypeptidase
MNIAYDTVRETIVSKNVAAILPGTKRPDETVVYTAHWDHLGIGEPDATGDTIYNGAVDNGTGLAALLELARAFGAAPKLERSVLFLAVTAEESGLLGSAYYAANPLYPLGKTVANLNMDALHPSGSAKDFSVSGNAPQTLLDDLIAVGAKHDRTLSPDSAPEAGYFYRSDHFSLAKVGVPAISIKRGQDLVEGGSTAGKAMADDYTDKRYHQPSDEYVADWNLDGIVQDTLLLYQLGRSLADSNRWPSWKEGAEFKAEREKTAAERK